MKVCSKCFKELSDDNFHKDNRLKSGLKSYCKICTKKYTDDPINKARLSEYTKNPEYKAQKKRRYDPAKGKAHKLKSNYGLTQEEYDLILETQNFACAICLITFKDIPREKHVDHCHITNIVRGILCNSCNNGLGRFKDDPNRLIRAAKYLEQYQN